MEKVSTMKMKRVSIFSCAFFLFSVLHESQQALFLNNVKRWPNKTVPFDFDMEEWTNTDPDDYKPVIRQAMNEFSRHTCVRFLKRFNFRNRVDRRFHIRFVIRRGSYDCSSELGYQGPLSGFQEPGRRFQRVKLSVNCAGSKGIVAHLLGKALGMALELTSPRREAHISLQSGWRYLSSNMVSYNQIADATTVYDYESIMHYGNNQAVADLDARFFHHGRNRMATTYQEFQRVIGHWANDSFFLSFKDNMGLNKYYRCDEQCPASPNCNLIRWRFKAEDCQCYCNKVGRRMLTNELSDLQRSERRLRFIYNGTTEICNNSLEYPGTWQSDQPSPGSDDWNPDFNKVTIDGYNTSQMCLYGDKTCVQFVAQDIGHWDYGAVACGMPCLEWARSKWPETTREVPGPDNGIRGCREYDFQQPCNASSLYRDSKMDAK